MNFVKRIIDDWDPIGLLSFAPEDEYHSEIEEIKHLLNLTDDSVKLAEGIYKIFLESFGEDVFTKSRLECREVAQKLLFQKC